MKPNIKTGVYNFSNFETEGYFYPEDLPSEWRLSYFANEFETACFHLKQESDLELLQELLGEPPENFNLSIALFDLKKSTLLSELLADYPDQIANLITANDLLPAVQKLSADSNIPIYCHDSTAANPSQLWQIDKPQDSAIALLPRCDDLKVCRQWIEQWLEATSHQELLLWVDAEKPSYTKLEQLRLLIELMGF